MSELLCWKRQRYDADRARFNTPIRIAFWAAHPAPDSTRPLVVK